MAEGAAACSPPRRSGWTPAPPDATTPSASAGRCSSTPGAVEPAYIDAMLERERSISTYLGEGVAIPHGTSVGRDLIHRDALAFVRFPDGADWDGNPVTVCIAIAARGDGHMAILAELAQVLMDPDRARALREASDPGRVLALLEPETEEEPTENREEQGHTV
ncbi:PTS sugar transporter subunit IIA [Actinomadura madurae]|uniref:PTS sugar transporter subunit IIA n=2 Tax=Actinomadura madurae TaxID=1993 RepID=UPI0027E2A3E8|nr:PTS sugar transporter subunit IIA [Actinomadura madurae]